MRPIESFLMAFYIMDACYDVCKEDDLGMFLSMISPELWSDGLPADKEMYKDWKKMVQHTEVTDENIIEQCLAYLQLYRRSLNLRIPETEQFLKTQVTKRLIEWAQNAAQKKCEKHQYTC